MPENPQDEWRIFLGSWGQWGILLLECAVLFLSILWGANSGPAWALPAGFVLVLGIALWAWWRALARARIIGNTPAERIASTAQGYARLAGRGQLLGGRQSVFEPGSGLPLLWSRVRYFDQESRSNDTEESDESFLLDDGSGAVCAVDPEGAEMLVRNRRTYTSGNGASVQYWYLRPGDRIYALGEFVTVGSIDPDLNTHRQVSELLEDWKADHAALLRRFDLDGDGQISEQEWELARAAAQREVERTQQEALAQPEAHVMRKPADGQPYLISDTDLGALARQFWLWAIVHGAVFIAATIALASFYARGDIR
ncbi:MAG: hypothetical protein LBI48_11625 [Burkholderiaceae bacterium]|jgi:hypothetical protein|nr:hypothetical protein [Burkholderiaceae bacterium]